MAVSSAFTFQGALNYLGAPVDGRCDFNFKLWDAASGGNQMGGDIVLAAYPVQQGSFKTVLDFGNVFTRDTRWLETTVQCPADPTLVVLDREQLTATPYAAGLRSGASVITGLAGDTFCVETSAIDSNSIHGKANTHYPPL